MRVFRWGKSLAFKVSKGEAQALGIEEGQDIKVITANNRARLLPSKDIHGG